MYILSQILIVISDLLCILSMLSKNKKKVIYFLILSTTFFALQYICLQGWTGAAIGFMEIVFLIILYVMESKNKTQYKILLSVCTMIATIIISVLTWDSWISFIPMLAMIIYLITMIFKNVIVVKSGAFIRITMNAIYMLLLESYLGSALSILILAFSVVGIVKDYNNKKLVKNEE